MRIASPPDSGYAGIALRPLDRKDLDEWFAYLSLSEVIEQTSWNVRSSQDLVPLIESCESTSATSSRRMAIVDQETDALVGTIDFHTVSEEHRNAEIAYDLSQNYWGRGIATAVCAAVTEWSFSTYGWVRVQATVLETNARSEHVLKKCGFAYEGVLRAYRVVRGTPGNFKMYARLNSD